MAPEPSTDVRAGLVSRALELRDEGRTDWLEAACVEYPELSHDVRAAVMEAAALPAIFAEGAGVDRRVGTEIGERYEVVRRLGAGAMGVVYEARDNELGRDVALKVLRPGLLDEQRAVTRFEREAQAMAAVVHPAIIAIHDRGRTTDGDAFIVMELVDGLQLGTIVEQLIDRVEAPTSIDGSVLSERLGIDTHGETSYVRIVVRWIADLASGLEVSHAQGVVHRDIKPTNIIVRRDGRPVLLDFGVAHLADAPRLTSGGSGVGTPAYMPPESLSRDRSVTNEADIYGLSAVLYTLLSLRAPYDGNPAEVLFALSSREPAALARLHAGLPRDLVAIVEKGMSRKATSRYASAQEFGRDLRAFLNHRPVTARPIGPLRRAARRVARSKVGLGAALALGVAALVFLGLSLRTQYLDGRYTRWVEASRPIPPNLGLLNPANRVHVHEADRAEVERVLDEAAALCVDPLPTYLLRAMFRLDHGDTAGAAKDMAVIALHEDTAFARALADAYAAVTDGASGSTAVDLGKLPVPETVRDRYLRGVHHLRAAGGDAAGRQEFAAARALIDEEAAAEVTHAAELRFGFTSFHRGLEPSERHRLALELYSDIRDHEARLGARTATTAHWSAFALQFLNRYASALEVCLEGIELAPRTHVNRINAAWSAFSLGDVLGAREHLRVALDVRPNDVKPVRTFVWTHVARAEFDEALGLVDERAPLLDAEPWWREEFSGVVETYRALDQWATLESVAATPGGEGAAELAPELLATLARARAHFAAAQESGAASVAPFAQKIIDALADSDGATVFRVLADESTRDPRRLWHVRLALQYFPASLGPEEADAAWQLFAAIERELNGSLSSRFTGR